ncbi:MAG: CDP-alcohol phosphatidyltransferase family protein [Lewinellaceae bacterium]|nr:CDP-alcohol phosphatidyltransferase family protein [Lewinellaceae bacterium]
MISIYQLKPAFQQLLQPVLRFLHRFGVTANQLTIAAVALSGGLGYLLTVHTTYPIALLLVPLGLLLRMAVNALDGMMARQHQMQSQLGEILNEMGDVLSDLFLIFPLITFSDLNPWLIILFAILSVLNEFAGLLGKALGGARRYEGPMGKSDRALLLGLFCLASYFWPSTPLIGNWIFGVACALLLLSTFTRLKKSLS